MQPAAAASLSGRVTAFGAGQPFPSVGVSVTGPVAAFTVTDSDGAYSFPELADGNYQVVPTLPTAFGGGATALDAVYTLLAALGLRTFSPEEAIACDANGSGMLTALDASLLMQYSVGLIARLPVAERCGSDWVMFPVANGLPGGAELTEPRTSPACQNGSVNLVASGVTTASFVAVKFGDCSGDWSPQVMFPSPTPTFTASVSPSFTPTASPTASPSPRPSASPTPTATRTATPSATPSWSPTVSPSTTPTASSTATATRTASPTVTATPTASPSPSATRSATPSATRTPLPCAGSNLSSLDRPLTVASHPDVVDASGGLRAGRAHVLTAVPTSTGWGLFWLRDTTENTFDVQLPSTLYYAHVGLGGDILAGPMPLVDIRRQDREPLYLVAWRGDHFGLLVNELVSLDPSIKVTYQYYYDVSPSGGLSARVGPIRTDLGYSGGIGDMVPYLDGFLVGIETVCQGSHQCSFAYKLADHGTSRGSDLRVVEFDGTHSFAPHIAYDGRGFAIVSSKDYYSAGIVSQYANDPGTFLSASRPVVPNKGFLNDNNPRVAWDGQRFGAIWREVQSLTSPGDTLWRMRMATFTRNYTSSALNSDRFVEANYAADQSIARSLAFTTDLSPVSDGWLASYARGRTSGEPEAVVQYLASDLSERASWVVTTLDDYAFSTRVHFAPGYERTLGIVTSHRTGSGVDVRFARLNLDCPP